MLRWNAAQILHDAENTSPTLITAMHTHPHQGIAAIHSLTMIRRLMTSCRDDFHMVRKHGNGDTAITHPRGHHAIDASHSSQRRDWRGRCRAHPHAGGFDRLPIGITYHHATQRVNGGTVYHTQNAVCIDCGANLVRLDSVNGHAIKIGRLNI